MIPASPLRSKLFEYEEENCWISSIVGDPYLQHQKNVGMNSGADRVLARKTKR
jgi:hypothetical protein